MTTTNALFEILAAAKLLAQRYRDLTGKPLGITGEVAEYEAARILGLTLTQHGKQATTRQRYARGVSTVSRSRAAAIRSIGGPLHV